MELVRGTNKTEIKNAHRQEHIRRRQQDTPQAEICPEEAAGYSTGRDMSGAGSRTLTGRDMSGAGSRTLTGRDMSGAGSRMLHRQEYTAGGSRRQQETPQVTHRQEYTGGDSRT